jgi:hypothetical protein
MNNVQTLVFRTTSKTTTLQTSSDFSFENVSTVAIRDGFYEIMAKRGTFSEKAIPVARLPIACTNMIILDE